MDIERALICKVISTGKIEEAISKGVRSEHFADDQCRDVFKYVLYHVRRYKSPPSEPIVKAEKPGFEWEYVQDPLDYLIDAFIKVVKRRYAQQYAVELAEACDDPERSENIDLEFLEVSRKLATVVPSTEVARFSEMEKRIDEYERKKTEGESFGIPFGFPTLDKWTGGIQPHEFATVSAFSGLGKSTLLITFALNFWVEGYTPLIISLEMEKSAILRKLDAMATGLDYQRLKQLDLPSESMENWRKTAEQIKEKSQDIPIIDSIRGCTPDHIFAETVRHKPDIVIVDYLSLMRSSRPNRGSSLWQSLTEITQDLKQNARTLKIPVLAAAQTNRGGSKDGAELDNIGYSISVIQDSDIVIGMHADEEMRERKEMEIRVNKNRDGRLGKFPMIWDYDEMNFREKTLKDLYGRPGQKETTSG